MRLVRLIFHPRVCRDPVHFPGLASIVRECLFETARIRSDARDYKPNKDGSALSVSWSKISPRPFLNSPIVGWLMAPPLLLVSV